MSPLPEGRLRAAQPLNEGRQGTSQEPDLRLTSWWLKPKPQPTVSVTSLIDYNMSAETNLSLPSGESSSKGGGSCLRPPSRIHSCRQQ